MMGKTIKLNREAIMCLPAILAIHRPDPTSFLVKAIALSLEIKNRAMAASNDEQVKAIIEEGRERLRQIKADAYKDVLKCEQEHNAAFDKLREAQPELKTVEFCIDHINNEVTIEGTRQDVVDAEYDDDDDVANASMQDRMAAVELIKRMMRQ